MGREKAFLSYDGQPFVSAIAGQLSMVSDDVVVAVGDKEPSDFGPLFGEGVRVCKDDRYLSNPLGGILTGLGLARHPQSAIVGCDTPLLRAEVIECLYEEMGDHVAAVPVWEEDEIMTMEPLCGVYSVIEARKAATKALESDASLKRMVMLLGDVQFVDVSRLRLVDPSLDSLVDINTPEEYARLEDRMRGQIPAQGQGGQ
ncbi:MAG: NTP transferase domain-containing protein [Nitrososphaerota archaeon]|nr:NTP transferase domain-containing protein [Nitrososphaerota archaeon]MDG7023826.1 NTP transferase domain-containing protein [Nitrososphaerota archaeon]